MHVTLFANVAFSQNMNEAITARAGSITCLYVWYLFPSLFITERNVNLYVSWLDISFLRIKYFSIEDLTVAIQTSEIFSIINDVDEMILVY